MLNTSSKPCPCGSGKSYQSCCFKYHKGETPKDAVSLMRSRYSAYALDLPEYIIKTTHPNNPTFNENSERWLKSIKEFCQSTKFIKLEVVNFIHGQDVAFVTFIANLIQNGRNASFMEKSRFEKKEGKWLYHSAQIS